MAAENPPAPEIRPLKNPIFSFFISSPIIAKRSGKVIKTAKNDKERESNPRVKGRNIKRIKAKPPQKSKNAISKERLVKSDNFPPIGCATIPEARIKVIIYPVFKALNFLKPIKNVGRKFKTVRKKAVLKKEIIIKMIINRLIE
mgnify:FL=1